MSEQIVRVLRVIEYTGPYDLVAEQVGQSIHGERKGIIDRTNPDRYVMIRVGTVGALPEILKGDN